MNVNRRFLRLVDMRATHAMHRVVEAFVPSYFVGTISESSKDAERIHRSI